MYRLPLPVSVPFKCRTQDRTPDPHLVHIPAKRPRQDDDKVSIEMRGRTRSPYPSRDVDACNTNFDDLPPSILARIASYTMSKPLDEIQEVRACNCLNLKRFPFRSGTTKTFHSRETNYHVPQDNTPCKIDDNRLGPWCRKQQLTHRPGGKHQIPSFALLNRATWKNWRDARIYVFCAESCLAATIRRLPEDNLRLMTRVRFFERDNKQDTIAESWEGYVTGLGGWYDKLVYENYGMTEIEYKGVKVWVKDLWLDGLIV